MSVASDSPKADSDETNDRSYMCSLCSQKFESEAILAVHKQKHQMTLTLGPSKLTSLADVLPVAVINHLNKLFDVNYELSKNVKMYQTPTPTRFLHLGNKLGLFDELNPFDREFKTAQKDGPGISSKQRRAAAAVHQYQGFNNKSKSPSTPTRPLASSVLEGMAYSVAAPMQVIAITPTLPSPVTALPGGASPFLVPPLLPSPQGLHIPSFPGYNATSPMQVPASLLSPTLMPYSGLIPGMPASLMADAQQRAAAFTHAMFAAAASAASPQVPEPISSSHTYNNNHSAISASLLSANMSEPVIHTNEHLNIPSIVLPKQERPMSVSSATSDTNSFPDMTNTMTAHQQTIQQADQFHHSRSDDNIAQYTAMHHSNLQTTSDTASIATSTFMANAQPVQTGSNQHQALEASAMSHPSLGSRASSEFGSNPNLLDAKQKLKESLTGSKGGLQQQNFDLSLMNQNISLSNASESGEEQKTPGRRRGRQSQDIDPDIKRQRFLERNRAAASRCRNKKKVWVNGLESKAKNLSQTNVMLQNEIAALKDEVATLKQLLLSHRDCPIMKMQQQSMSLAGINLDLTSSVTLTAVKSEMSSNSDSLHPPLGNSLSNSSLSERSSSSQQNAAASSLSNGAMYPTLSSAASS